MVLNKNNSNTPFKTGTNVENQINYLPTCFHIEPMKNDKEIILKLSKSLFWDCNPENIEAEKHALLIIERVLSIGTWEDFKAIISYYGKSRIGEYVIQLRYMDKIVLAFCITYFNISKEKFRCYTERQLHPTHWDY